MRRLQALVGARSLQQFVLLFPGKVYSFAHDRKFEAAGEAAATPIPSICSSEAVLRPQRLRRFASKVTFRGSGLRFQGSGFGVEGLELRVHD